MAPLAPVAMQAGSQCSLPAATFRAPPSSPGEGLAPSELSLVVRDEDELSGHRLCGDQGVERTDGRTCPFELRAELGVGLGVGGCELYDRQRPKEVLQEDRRPRGRRALGRPRAPSSASVTTLPRRPRQGRLEDGKCQTPLRIRRAPLQLGEGPEAQDPNDLPLDLDLDALPDEVRVLAPSLDGAQHVELPQGRREQLVSGAEERFPRRSEDLTRGPSPVARVDGGEEGEEAIDVPGIAPVDDVDVEGGQRRTLRHGGQGPDEDELSPARRQTGEQGLESWRRRIHGGAPRRCGSSGRSPATVPPA